MNETTTATTAPSAPEVRTFDLWGWGAWEDAGTADSVRVGLFRALHELSHATVEHYQGDYYRDAQWIAQTFHGAGEFFYSFDDCGTWISYDEVPGLCRDNAYRCAVACERGRWSLTVTRVTL